MHSLTTPEIKNAGWQAGGYGELQIIRYQAHERSSRVSQSFSSRLSVGTIGEVLGLILLSLCWESTTDSDRATLLTYADALERLLIDFRRGGLQS